MRITLREVHLECGSHCVKSIECGSHCVKSIWPRANIVCVWSRAREGVGSSFYNIYYPFKGQEHPRGPRVPRLGNSEHQLHPLRKIIFCVDKFVGVLRTVL